MENYFSCPLDRRDHSRPSATPWNPDLPFILAVFLTPSTLCQSFEAFLCILRTGTLVHLKNRDICEKTEELKELKKITQRWVYYQPTHSDDDSDFFFFLAFELLQSLHFVWIQNLGLQNSKKICDKNFGRKTCRVRVCWEFHRIFLIKP